MRKRFLLGVILNYASLPAPDGQVNWPDDYDIPEGIHPAGIACQHSGVQGLRKIEKWALFRMQEKMKLCHFASVWWNGQSESGRVRVWPAILTTFCSVLLLAAVGTGLCYLVI